MAQNSYKFRVEPLNLKWKLRKLWLLSQSFNWTLTKQTYNMGHCRLIRMNLMTHLRSVNTSIIDGFFCYGAPYFGPTTTDHTKNYKKKLDRKLRQNILPQNQFLQTKNQIF